MIGTEEQWAYARARAEWDLRYPMIQDQIFIPCRCCHYDVLPFVGGSYPEHQLCDDCGRGKCDDCIDEVRALLGMEPRGTSAC